MSLHFPSNSFLLYFINASIWKDWDENNNNKMDSASLIVWEALSPAPTMSLSYLITFRHPSLPAQTIQVFVSSRSSKLFTISPKSVLPHIAPHHAPFALIIKMNYSLFPKGVLRLCLCCSLYLKCPPQSSLIFQDTAISSDFFKKLFWLCHRTTGSDASGSQITLLLNERDYRAVIHVRGLNIQNPSFWLVVYFVTYIKYTGSSLILYWVINFETRIYCLPKT